MNKIKSILKKQRFLLPLTLLLVFLAGMGITRAYFTDESIPITNIITYADTRLEAMLTEPDWDGVTSYTYDREGNPSPVGGKEQETDYGQDLAGNLIPGITVPKDPKITNISNKYVEWAAMKVTFVYAAGANAGKPFHSFDYERLADILDIDWNDEKWELVSQEDASAVFYYEDILKKNGEETEPLFSAVHIPGEKTTNEDMRFITELGGFVIYLEGFVVQASEELSDYADFRQWGMEGGVNFAYSPSEDRAVTISGSGIFGKYGNVQ